MTEDQFIKHKHKAILLVEGGGENPGAPPKEGAETLNMSITERKKWSCSPHIIEM
jgi:hypothetical protein